MVRTLKFIDSEKIRDEIALLGLSEHSFAKEHKLDPTNFNLYLNGKKNPSGRTAKKIANAFGKQVRDIFVV